MKPVVGILEYDCGNIRSVSNAIKAIGAEYKLIKSREDLAGISKLILPGVGAFDVAMRSLNDMGMGGAIKDYVSVPENKLLGICLGMQLLCNQSEEGSLPGLGLINADVVSLKHFSDVKVPHIGWNTVKFIHSDPLVNGLNDEVDYYFVHSYCVMAKDDSVILGLTKHGVEFVPMVNNNNIWGVQFHPEKSQGPGLKLMSNFIKQC